MSSSDTTAKLPLLKELELVAKQSWRLILGCAAAGFVIAAVNLQRAHYSYPVEMQVTQVQSTGSGGPGGGRMNQLSGLASLAGVSMPSTQNEVQFQLFTDSLKSRDVADELAKNQELMIALYGGQWDPITKTWFEPATPASTRIKYWLRGLLGLAPVLPWHPPNGENVASLLANNLEVLQDPRKTYMVSLRFTSGSREFSANFLTLLVKTADRRLRDRALERARVYIDYLSNKLSTVTVSEHRDALSQALGEQERYAMVASSDKPFAAEIFQSPWASNLPSTPSPRMNYAFWVLLGAASALAFAFLRHRYQENLRRSLWVQRLPAFIRRQLTSPDFSSAV
jgi:hypothetical protein